MGHMTPYHLECECPDASRTAMIDCVIVLAGKYIVIARLFGNLGSPEFADFTHRRAEKAMTVPCFTVVIIDRK